MTPASVWQRTWPRRSRWAWGRVVAAVPSGAFLVAVSMIERRAARRGPPAAGSPARTATPVPCPAGDDLRHAAVSTWLNASGNPAQVAEWAGHSVDVLLRTYAKCIAGQQEEAKRRTLEATQPNEAPQPPHGDSAPGCYATLGRSILRHLW